MHATSDPRFARYTKPRTGEDTIDWATEYVRGYIEACGDPLADGHIHHPESSHATALS